MIRVLVIDDSAVMRAFLGRVVASHADMELVGVSPDPLLAIGDALATFPADEIVVAAGAEFSTARALDLVARARERFALPVLRADDPQVIAA